ncbi:Protein of unknown function (DUF3706) [Thioflavicoccus mobilis 8321]|uniref:Phosphoribosyl transferase family protein n=1 Tax=Thioflavicoccus mobilis 8321 TaxID=765912 RepID=L0H292_9GAMM|nr:phosphoribosyltransferase domain-containing protein [Thioflavicoccus mobilis]AGA92351.1 Protein of unknown function (DUF3706) [Thioflavicoccus mobilis 8321]
MDYQIDLACGRLHIRTVREELPLAQLIGFASRQNPRRGFLFVSRVLGKHVPCAPRAMRDTYERLARPLGDSPGPVLALGLAETATGLGGGIADSLARGEDDVLFQHTTRHRLDVPVLLRFDEVHSHAPDHILYTPDSTLAARYRDTATLALIDDEITTGRTLTRLAEALARHLPALREIVFVSLVNWLDTETRRRIQVALPVPTRFVSLIEGTFDFTPDPAFAPTLPDTVLARRAAPWPARDDLGRRGVAMPADAEAISHSAQAIARGFGDGPQPVTVVGTGELAYPAFLLAENLERLGLDVRFQGTTRSPILAGGAIAESLSFLDEHGEGVQNYLHNPPPAGGRTVVVYESDHLDGDHALPQLLGAEVCVLPRGVLTEAQPR